MCMWLINSSASLADLIAPQLDTMALEREVAKVRRRGGAQLASGPSRKRNENSLLNATDIAGDSAIAETASTGIGSLAEVQRAWDQHSIAETAQNTGIVSLSEVEKYLSQQSAAEVARNMGIGALTALEGQRVRKQLATIDAARNSGLGTFAAVEAQKVRDQLSAGGLARNLGIGSASLADLLAKAQEGKSK
jgi:hypothetical protein